MSKKMNACLICLFGSIATFLCLLVFTSTITYACTSGTACDATVRPCSLSNYVPSQTACKYGGSTLNGSCDKTKSGCGGCNCKVKGTATEGQGCGCQS